jgi:TRAP-type mannitol/chloroaromatic compound transport system permease small subunit
MKNVPVDNICRYEENDSCLTSLENSWNIFFAVMILRAVLLLCESS